MTLAIGHPLGIFIEEFTGDQYHESHLGLQIREIQGPCNETGQSLRSLRFREGESSLRIVKVRVG